MIRIVPSGFPIYDAARDRFLDVLDTPNTDGLPQTWGWEIDGIKYVTAAGAAMMEVSNG